MKSLVVRRIHGFNDDILHPSGVILLAGMTSFIVSTSVVVEALKHLSIQLTRHDGNGKILNRAALALAAYGCCIFVFW